MLEVIHLSKKYRKTLAVDDISFMVKPGQVGILLGPNGAGKSTIIKCISGLLRYDGQVRINGLAAESVEARKQFAYIPEIPGLYPLLTVREHFEFIAKAYGLTHYTEPLEHWITLFDLADKQNKLGDELSKGMMQKVSIICGLMIQPQVILLDEPMVGLDPKAIKVLRQEIQRLKEEGCTILISTHMLDMVEEMWDVVFVMKKGKIAGSYSEAQVKETGSTMEDMYFTITEEEI